MIFAEMQYQNHYSEFHAELVEFIKSNFTNVECGLQGDSWIWIFDENDKVAIDTFSSMKHQVKCENPNSSLTNKVINALSNRYKLRIYSKPEREPHEDI